MRAIREGGWDERLHGHGIHARRLLHTARQAPGESQYNLDTCLAQGFIQYHTTATSDPHPEDVRREKPLRLDRDIRHEFLQANLVDLADPALHRPVLAASDGNVDVDSLVVARMGLRGVVDVAPEDACLQRPTHRECDLVHKRTNGLAREANVDVCAQAEEERVQAQIWHQGLLTICPVYPVRQRLGVKVGHWRGKGLWDDGAKSLAP
eukprot:1706797-Rhodomonas_salina.6